jgi:hypothetical protein
MNDAGSFLPQNGQYSTSQSMTLSQNRHQAIYISSNISRESLQKLDDPQPGHLKFTGDRNLCPQVKHFNILEPPQNIFYNKDKDEQQQQDAHIFILKFRFFHWCIPPVSGFLSPASISRAFLSLTIEQTRSRGINEWDVFWLTSKNGNSSRKQMLNDDPSMVFVRVDVNEYTMLIVFFVIYNLFSVEKVRILRDADPVGDTPKIRCTPQCRWNYHLGCRRNDQRPS